MSNKPKLDHLYMVTTSGENWFEAIFSHLCNDDGNVSWVACDQKEAPSCWTDGVCWTSNENDEPSAPVIEWREL